MIEAAYRRLARIYHPDVNSSPDSGAMMQRLNHAYETLSNTQKRLAYDLTRPRSGQQQRAATGRDRKRPASTTPGRPLRISPFIPIVGGLFVVLLAAVIVTQGFTSIPSFGSGGDSPAADLPVAGPTATIAASPTPTATAEPLETPEPTATATSAPAATPTPEPITTEPTQDSPSGQVTQLLASMATGDTATIEVSVEDPVLVTELQNEIRRQGGTVISVTLNQRQTLHIIRFGKLRPPAS